VVPVCTLIVVVLSSFVSISVCCALLTGLLASLVLSTFASPTSDFTIPVGVLITGDVFLTVSQVPVDVVTPVPQLATGSVQVTWVVRFINALVITCHTIVI
tara:strand:- start:11908 stop:12210 length:303 start_codon:yes stop_codon:yes gene_type:complete